MFARSPQTLALPLLLVSLSAAWCAQPPVAKDGGDLLPPGAIARFGSARWRPGAGCVALLGFAPNGKTLLAVDGAGNVSLWDSAEGTKLHGFSAFSGTVRCAAMSRDGRMVALAGDDLDPQKKRLVVYDVATGKELIDPLVEMNNTIGGVYAGLAFAPDGKELAVRYFGSSAVTVRDLRTGQFKHQLGSAFNPTSWGGTISTNPHALAYTIDGSSLMGAGERQPARTWNLNLLGAPPEDTSGPEKVVALALARDGKRMAWMDDAKLWLGDLAWKGRVLAEFPTNKTGSVPNLAFASKRPVLAAVFADGAVHVWDLDANKHRQLLPASWVAVSALALSEDGTSLVVSLGPVLRVWDVATGKEKTVPVGHQQVVSSAALSPDGKLLVTAGDEGEVRYWDAATGTQLRVERPRYGCSELHFSPDGKWIVGPAHKAALTIWDAATLKETQTIALQVSQPRVAAGILSCQISLSPVAPLATAVVLNEYIRSHEPWRRWYVIGFSSDGKRLLTQQSNSVCYWDVATGHKVRQVDVKPNRIQEVFSGGGLAPHATTHVQLYLAFDYRSDGKRTVYGGLKNGHITAEVLDIDLERPLASFEIPVLTASVSFAPRGNSLLVTLPPQPVGSATSMEPALRLVEVHTGKDRADLPLPAWSCRVAAVSPNGRLAAILQQTLLLRLVDVVTGEEIGQFQAAHAGKVDTVFFSQDGRRLVTVGADATVVLWDVAAVSRPLKDLAPKPLSAGDLDKLWTALASDNAKHAFVALWTLAAAPTQTVPFLKTNLATGTPDATQIKRWIEDLDSVKFAIREKAHSNLARLGTIAEPALRNALVPGLSLEMKLRLEALLGKIEKQGMSPHELRRLRAVEVLGLIGTAPAMEVLQQAVAANPEGRLKQDALRALTGNNYHRDTDHTEKTKN